MKYVVGLWYDTIFYPKQGNEKWKTNSGIVCFVKYWWYIPYVVGMYYRYNIRIWYVSFLYIDGRCATNIFECGGFACRQVYVCKAVMTVWYIWFGYFNFGGKRLTELNSLALNETNYYWNGYGRIWFERPFVKVHVVS